MPRHRHDPSKDFVGFAVGDVEYAVAIACVREITNPQGVVALPHSPPAVIGVADYRGQVVPIVDLRLRFGLPPSAATRKNKWIVIDAVGRAVALVVDAVTEVFGSGGVEPRAAPSLGGAHDLRAIAGVTRHGQGLVFVLDTARLRELVEPLTTDGRLLPVAARPDLPPGAST